MRDIRVLAGVLGVLSTAASETLPYDPTRILLDDSRSSAYLFQDSQLSVLDLDKQFTTSAKSLFAPVTKDLPFSQAGELVPYTPVIDQDGNITVIAGNCSLGAKGAEVWRFVDRADGKGTWERYQTSAEEAEGLGGSNFLADGMAFSRFVEADAGDTDVYIFGGMCPDANSTADTWTTAAEYSDLMLQIAPKDSSTEYDVSLVSARGPPIAEAGLTVTPLSPTYAANISGEPQTQQQDFVLLGGHTQGAFINMSQVALFSLPQESWTFLPVAQPAEMKTDLAARESSTKVTPRSGHTAVLSEDGASIVVFGGWVGDVSNPADPQLAVLEFTGEGSDSNWNWRVPKQSGSGLASGTGIYGHGAAMLPGGIMLVVGGHTIPASSSKRTKREANSQVYLYNVTSHTWIDTYMPTNTLAEKLHEDSGLLSTKSEQAGLGAGLGIGAALLICLVLFYLWYSRRTKRAREARGRALLSRSSDGSFAGNLEQPFLGSGGIDGRGGETAGGARFWNVWDPNTGTYPQREPEMQQQNAAGSTSFFVDVPSPTRGLRKGVAGRNYQYHAAPRYEDNRLSRGSGVIHPIAEREDEDSSSMNRPGSGRGDLTDAERKLRELERVLCSDDPFKDNKPNPLGSHPVSPELDVGSADTLRRVPTGASCMATPLSRQGTQDRADVPNWIAEPEPEDALLVDTGRTSPTKTDERTSSTLSEHSTISTNSITRTMSTRTGARLAADIRATSPEHSSSGTNTMSTSGGRKSPYYFQTRTRSSTNGSTAPASAGTDADSFTTARSNFIDLQFQGEALLGGRPRDDPYQRAIAATSTTNNPSYQFDSSAPPLISAPRRRPGWMGSLRRAINAVAMGDRSLSMTSTYTPDSTTPTPSANTSTAPRRYLPRRAVSDGGALLRQKRGQKDWEGEPYHDYPDTGDWGSTSPFIDRSEAAEQDWDVEGAAGRRDVQIMFTVPKSRLRVVNADMERASLRSASDGAGSVRTMTVVSPFADSAAVEEAPVVEERGKEKMF